MLDRIEAVLTGAVRSCRTAQAARALRRALLDALQQLDDRGDDE